MIITPNVGAVVSALAIAIGCVAIGFAVAADNHRKDQIARCEGAGGVYINRSVCIEAEVIW